MKDFSWAPKEIVRLLSRKEGKIMLGCDSDGCSVLRATPGKTELLKRYAKNPTGMIFCRTHGGKHGKFTKEEISSWPKDHKRCRDCLEVKPFSEFSSHSSALFGKDVLCRLCRVPQSKVDRSKRTTEQNLLAAAKHRAKESGMDFNIDISDIVVPEKCPVFGVALTPGHRKFGPSLDRIDSAKGYVKGNVQVLSRWANTLKGDATLFEVEALYRFMMGVPDDCAIAVKHISENLPEGSNYTNWAWFGDVPKKRIKEDNMSEKEKQDDDFPVKPEWDKGDENVPPANTDDSGTGA